jgi:hypothetical protein
VTEERGEGKLGWDERRRVGGGRTRALWRSCNGRGSQHKDPEGRGGKDEPGVADGSIVVAEGDAVDGKAGLARGESVVLHS